MPEYEVTSESVTGFGGRIHRKGDIITDELVGQRRVAELLKGNFIRVVPSELPMPNTSISGAAKLIVAVVVYDRIENLRIWLRCYNSSDKCDSEMVVIHNCDNQYESNKYKQLCDDGNVKYIRRENAGYDIGAFQDVCKNRLKGFPTDWNYLFWSTDDFIPMRNDFIRAYMGTIINSDCGVACLEISREVKLHIRTSAFIIDRLTAGKLSFPAEPVTTKEHCYQFEHRSNTSLIDQILRLGKKPIQVERNLASAHLWDTGERLQLNRWKEHYLNFPVENTLFVCPIFNSYPQIISALLCQTNPNWKLLLIHDGENSTGLAEMINGINDSRIQYVVHQKRANDWGHTLRRWALEKIKTFYYDVEFVVITNPDNYYIPIFVEQMTNGIKVNNNTVAAYCSHFVHGYVCPDKQLGNHRFRTIESKIQLGHIDCGGVMVRKKYACEVGWSSLEIYSDWTYFTDLTKKYGADKWVKVAGTLFVHN